MSPDAGTLAVRVTGDGAHPVAVLHGLGADHGQPLTLVGAPGPTWRWVAPDLRAHGGTTLPEEPADLTVPRLADDVAALLAEYDRPVTLVGISLGAAVALDLLAGHSLDVRAMVLVRPAWRWSPSPPNLAVLPLMGELLVSNEAGEARAGFVRHAEFRRLRQEAPAAAEALLEQFTAPRARERAARLVALPASAPRRPDRRVPALVVGNDLDPVHPIETALAVARDLEAEFRQVPPRYDRPEEHSAQVRRLVRDVVAGAAPD
jgi:pimeloyl-ACP methyl ester carboxylesterase